MTAPAAAFPPPACAMRRNALAAPPWLTRERVLVMVLALATLGVGWLCLRMVAPFVPALTWALTLAVVGQPIHRWLGRRVKRPGAAAALSTAAVTLTIALPAVVVGALIAGQAIDTTETIRTIVAERRWTTIVERHPSVAPVIDWLARQMQDGTAPQGLAQGALRTVRDIVASSVGVVVGALVTVFFLFYFFRDRRMLLSAVPHFLPLSRGETDEVLTIVHDTIEAIVYGTLVVSAIQGVLGGLAFWWLGLPSPLLWGAVMALLSVLPLFGAALVWGPAALYLALTGEAGSALMLVAWGAGVVGLVDNLLKPMLVRGRMNLHTLPVFIAVLGGVAVFGGTGLVLGPVVLAVAMGLLDVWRRRLAAQGSAEAAPDEPR